MPPIDPRTQQRTQHIPLLFAGCSQQPPQARLAAHLSDAENAIVGIADGLTRRAGFWVMQHLASGLLPSGNNRIHPIVRDQNERYTVIHNRTSAASIIRILDLYTNTWATVDQTLYGSAAQTYINAASPDEFRFRTLLDYTLILNTDVKVTATQKAGIIDQATVAAATVVRSTANHGLTAGNGTITAISATAPAVCTDVTHGLTTGQTVTIIGSDSIPSVDGTYHVRVIDADHFEIPVVVTTAGTTGTWTRGELIVIEGSDSVPVIDGAFRVTVTDGTHFTIPVNVTTAGTKGTWSFAQPDSSTMPAQLVRRNIAGSGTITVITTANPAVVTCASHGLYTGQTITVSGSNSTPTIDGARVVTVLSVNTFSVPVDTSAGVAGTAGTWVSQAYFQLDTIIWGPRASGDASINRVSPVWNGRTTISDLRYWRGRLGLYAGQRMLYSQAEDLFNFFIEDVNAVADSDPIDVPISSDEVAVMDYAVPIRDTTLLLTKAGKQFVVATGSQGLTAASIQAKPVTAYRTLRVEPAVMDPAIYYAARRGDAVQLLEYAYDEVAAPSAATDVSEHVPTFVGLTVDLPSDLPGGTVLPSELRAIVSSPELGFVLLLRRDKLVSGEVFSRYLFTYRTRFIDGRKVQSAWTRWKAAGVRGIHDICVIGDQLFALAHMAPVGTGTSGTISAVSVANPTHITSVAHGLVSGQSVTIAATNTNVSTVGTFVVTVLDADHFTVPVNVTVVTLGTGTWTLANFDFFVLELCLAPETGAFDVPSPIT